MAIATSLPLIETVSPADEPALAAILAEAGAARSPVYPLGGKTSLDYGATATRPGLGLSLAGLTKIIDYPARDMTITAQAGVTLAELARVLAAERQWLPIASPRPDEATLGGLMATAWSDGRRHAWGTMRDYVIGVRAVDGRGMPFKAGGRVVKNVAGYDFCKLLTGSLGTLGVITEVTLKLKPLPARTALIACRIHDASAAETILARLAATATSPAAIELLAGGEWTSDPALNILGPAEHGYLVIGLDGSEADVDWMLGAIPRELREVGIQETATIADDAAADLWRRMRDFPADLAFLTLKISVTPSRVCEMIHHCRRACQGVGIQAHAGNGVVLAKFAADEFVAESNATDSRETAPFAGLLGRLRALAAGHVTIVSSAFTEPRGTEITWGPAGPSTAWMRRVQQQFDPWGILNPDRFGFGSL